VHPDLERLIAEDEVARASVAAASDAARRAVDAARAELAQARDERLRELQRRLDADVEAIRRESLRDAATRQGRRAAFDRERADAAAAAMDEAVALCVAVLRGGPAPPEPR